MLSKAAANVTKFRFDQMATLINDRVDNPAVSGVERYVGLEHLEADSLRIRRWGEITDVESTKLRFQPGDIIFGKRRVYQRKLAVADFEGICSAHAMVLRAKPNVVLPEFMPFFMQSDLFMERALAISVGSLSPTINWTTLAAELFPLPPIEEQRRLVRALRASSNSFENCQQLVKATDVLVRAGLRAWLLGEGQTEETFVPHDWIHARPPEVKALPHGWKVSRLTEVAQLESGHTPSRRRAEYWNGNIPWISLHDTASLNRAEICDTAMHPTQAGIDNSSARILPKGTVVVSRTASVGLVSMMGCPMATSQDFANFICDAKRLEAGYLYFYLRYLSPYLNAIASGSTHKTVYMPFFEQMQIPVPPLEVQRRITAQLRSLETGSLRARQRQAAALKLHQQVVNTLMRLNSA